MTPPRGSILWADLGTPLGSEQGGRRPVLVVSRDAINRTSPVVIVVPLTSYRGQRLYPSDVLVRAGEGGLAEDSVALGLQIRVLSKHRLGTILGAARKETMSAVDEALLQVLDLPGSS